MKIFHFQIFHFLIALSFGFVVEIENGKIIGKEHENFYAYRGITYAIAERFSLSSTYSEKWSYVRKFEEYGPVCAQYEHFSYGFMGDENCLSLNVFVPKKAINANEQVPVIFYIHGGAFMFGGALYYGPEKIMKDERMILVTINYRLGILGFLSTEDEVLPGNLGLKDQVEALKWVQRNIQAFNGDPKRVTIVGYSAGGASVHLHYMSKLSNGLFNNGISHSGVATNSWVMMEDAREKAHKVAEYSGCPVSDHFEMLKCLKEKPVEDLTVIAKHFQPFLYNPFSPFGVVVESNHKNAFISEHPLNILEKGRFKKIPWLLSQVKDEGTYPSGEFYKDEKTLQEIDEKWEELAPHILDFDGLSKDKKLKRKVADMIRKFYLQDKKISRKNFQAFNDVS
jgi:carboxylesterase type B